MMVRVRYLLCALLAGLALSACSGPAKLGVLPPAPAVAPPPAIAPAPDGTAEPGQARAVEGGRGVVSGPDGAVWTKSGVTKTRIHADMDNCTAYARGQISHDARIERETFSAFDTSSGGLGLIELRARMNAFERNRRTPALIRECMEAGGYARR